MRKTRSTTFADRLRAAIVADGRGLAEIAAAAGVSRVTLHNLLSGKSPLWSTVQALADALGISTEQLRVA